MDREASTSHIHVLERLLLDENAEPMNLPLSLLEDITNGFSLDNLIGSGGSAVVYKGVLRKGLVAVKKLSNTFPIHENKFKEEVKCLIKAKHKNIVRFLGYCVDTQGKMEEYKGNLVMADQRNWLLCFDYVCNGSLDEHITGASYGLSWRQRYQVIRGICEGLLFLHEKRIIHLDLKPTNILLDSHMVPKIADFGLSRILGQVQSRAITQNICGTPGYMDPEYITSGQITFASDIYSLGVIIIEILTGARQYLEDEHVVQSWMIQLEASEGDMQLEQVRLCYTIGIECMNDDPKKRPVARHIVDRLDKTTSVDHSDETSISFELQVSLPRDQSKERMGNLAAESLHADVDGHSEILEDVRKPIKSLPFPEGQQKLGQSSLWDGKDMMEKVTHHGAGDSSSISTGSYELNILGIYTNIFDRKRHKLGQSQFINIFRKEELRPILKSSNLIRKSDNAEVYKGVVHNALVAVNKMFNGKDKQLVNEIVIQSQIIHKNIARLIGCCLQMGNPILVYEFLPRGSLHDILHNGNKVPLNLDVRLNIIAESAQGLAYLHSQARTEILHGNIKTTSVLLDDNYIPKISDFSMSMFIGCCEDSCYEQSTGLFISDKTYMDPSYMQARLLTLKSDVYSFGVVILELISRKKPIHTDGVRLVQSFIEFHKEGKKKTELFDKEIAVTTGDLDVLECLVEIALECLNLDVYQRPTMTDVAKRLLILNQSWRLHAWHVSADYSKETDINNSFVEQKKLGHLPLQDMNRSDTGNSSSVFTSFYKLNNLDIFNRKGRRNFNRNIMHALEKSHFIRIFRKEELMPMLRNSNSFGKSPFGVDYKVIVDDAFVMVKEWINGNDVGIEHFENDVLIESQVIHKNIVRLIGCCLERKSCMLVHEFLPRGSLDDILRDNKVPLSLDVRLSIIVGSAQGLAYLHSQAHTKIMHGAVNPRNILLDDNFVPKITGFGMSRLITGYKTSSVIGIAGYIDPVYKQTEVPSGKSDVYSFGIVILELISRKKVTSSENGMLVRGFHEFHKEGKKATELFDKEIAVTTTDLELLDGLAEIAVECLNLDADQRPTMIDVAERLVILNQSRKSKVGS